MKALQYNIGKKMLSLINAMLWLLHVPLTLSAALRIPAVPFTAAQKRCQESAGKNVPPHTELNALDVTLMCVQPVFSFLIFMTSLKMLVLEQT